MERCAERGGVRVFLALLDLPPSCLLTGPQVHKASRRADGTSFAIKIVQSAEQDFGGAIQEVRLLRELRSDFVVQLFDWTTLDDEVVVLVTEYCEGGELKDKIQPGEGIEDEILLWRWAEEMVQGIVYIHSQNIIHRDIKPANVLITHDGHAKIADLGIARAVESSFSATMTFAGTAAYMAPEVIDSVHHYCAKADVWSLGIVLFEMLAGRRPDSAQDVDDRSEIIPDMRGPDARTLLNFVLVRKSEDRPASNAVLSRVQQSRQQRCYAKAIEFVKVEDEEAQHRRAERQRIEKEARVRAAVVRDKQISDAQTEFNKQVNAQLKTYDDHTAICLENLRNQRRAFTDCSEETQRKVDAIANVSTADGAVIPILPEALICVSTLGEHTDAVLSVAFSSNGFVMASSSRDKTVRLWDTGTATCTNTLKGHECAVNCVSFHQSGQTLASASDDRTLKIWNVDSGACMHTLQGHNGAIFCTDFAPGGNPMLASGSSDKTVQIWDSTLGVLIHSLAAHTGAVFSVAFSPTENMLASASFDKTVKLWNIEDFLCMCTLEGHTRYARCVAFFPSDGTILASASEDKTVRVWDCESQENTAKLDEHTDYVYTVAFAPSGTVLASGSDDMTVRLWDFESGECTRALTGHTGSVRSVAFKPTGGVLASASEDGTVRLWQRNV